MRLVKLFTLLIIAMCCQNALIASPTHLLGEGEGEPLHHVIWDNLEGVQVFGNSVTKTSETGWNAGMFSKNKLPAGDNGWIEFQVQSMENYYMVGLSRHDLSTHYVSIEYAWYVRPNGFYIYKGGQYNSFFEGEVGEVLQIEKEGEMILMKKNGVVVREFQIEGEPEDYHIDVSIYEQGTFEFEVKATFEAKFNVNRFRTLTSLTNSGTTFSKSLGYGWNAGFFSEGKIAKNKDGFIEHKVVNQSKYYMVGLSDEDLSPHWNTIDYAWYVRPNKAYIYSDGRYQTVVTSYPGDILRIEKIGSTIYMMKNNITIRTFNCDAEADYHIDASFLHTGSYDVPLSASFPNPSSSYVILKKKLDGGRAIVNGDLKFKFIQEYAVTNTATINYKVYNWQRNAVLDSDLSLQYGVNWFTVPTNALNDDETYTLELEGNKGQKYYIKFKYQENQPWEEEHQEEPSEE